MTAPSHSLRFVFALSMFICSIILVLFLRGSAALTTEFWVQLFAAALALCTAICFLAFRKGNMRLVDVPLGRLVRVFLWQLVFVYIASATAFSAIAMAVVYAAMRSAPNSFALAVMAGLWLSLWLAPGIAAFTSWRKLRGAPGNGA